MISPLKQKLNCSEIHSEAILIKAKSKMKRRKRLKALLSYTPQFSLILVHYMNT